MNPRQSSARRAQCSFFPTPALVLRFDPLEPISPLLLAHPPMWREFDHEDEVNLRAGISREGTFEWQNCRISSRKV